MSSPFSSNLLSIVTTNPPVTINEVIQVMQRLDAVLPETDGLKWFNLLYMKVTQQVEDNPPVGGWNDAVWLTRLDVIFANFYFHAIADSLTGGSIPASWQALFEARQRTDLDRIQFALAGMNAHINHDLALALLQLDSEMHKGFSTTTPEHQDFENVNGLLEKVLPMALQFLAAGAGILGQIAQDTGKIGRMLASWNVRKARDLAWDFGNSLQSHPDPWARNLLLAFQDSSTGAIGRLLLSHL